MLSRHVCINLLVNYWHKHQLLTILLSIAGRRATLGSYTNTPKATAPNPDADAKAEISNQPQRSPNSSTPVAANKENQEAQRAGSTPVSAGTPRSQAKFAMSAKRLSYVPVIPSPLLKDTTGITKQQKL